ncbi:hypothetical protein US8_01255 [Bacillus altitudinis]|nr:hypothetical protein US8_01255 [Bacillus altitudinis]
MKKQQAYIQSSLLERDKKLLDAIKAKETFDVLCGWRVGT